MYSYCPRNNPQPQEQDYDLHEPRTGALITRDAHVAVSALKNLVDSVAEKIRVAERETVGVAIGRRLGDEPLRTLRDAAETLQSPNLEAAVSLAREKMQKALDWHLKTQET